MKLFRNWLARFIRPKQSSWKVIADKANDAKVEDGIMKLWLPLVSKIEGRASRGLYDYCCDLEEDSVFRTKRGREFLKSQGLTVKVYTHLWIEWDK